MRYFLSLLCLLIASCGGGGSDPIQASQSQLASVGGTTSDGAPSLIRVEALTLLSETRVSRTEFDYVYRLTVSNGGSAATGIVLTLSSAGPGTSVRDDSVLVGDLAAGQTSQPNDTITIRQDRTVPFDSNALTWTVTQIVAPPVGILLPGAPSDPAVNAISDFVQEGTYPLSESEIDPSSGAQIFRSLIGIAFKQGATVGDINALLQSIGGRIVNSLDRTAMLYVRIPDPGSLPAYRAVVTQVSTFPFVDFVTPTVVPDIDVFPEVVLPGDLPSAVQLLDVDHLIASKALPSWNAQDALRRSPAPNVVFLVGDVFGQGNFFQPLIAGSLAPGVTHGFDFGCVAFECKHGYHVLGIASGSMFDFVPVAGMFPSRVFFGQPPLSFPLYVVDVSSGKQLNATDPPINMMRLARAIRILVSQGKKVVVSTSLNDGDQKFAGDPALNETRRREWVRLINGGFGDTPSAAVLSNYFHAASAGNCAANVPNCRAEFNSGWNAATVAGDLPNTLTVENRGLTYFPASGILPGCLDPSSFKNGRVAAIGSRSSPVSIVSPPPGNFPNGVVSFSNPFGDVIQFAGTSMSTPQVSGLALYLWQLRPDLTGAEIADIILGHAVAPTLCPGDGGKLNIDAYASVLAMDTAESNAGAKVRLAVLDVAKQNGVSDGLEGDGQFTYEDLQVWDSMLSRVPVGRDYSRYDLNGDGFTGGTTTARFNLDISYAGKASTYTENVVRTIGSTAVTFNESTLTDLQILCYYAYGPLYTGGTAERDLLIGAKCGAGQSVTLIYPDAVPGWVGLPATMILTNLQARSIIQFQINGNSATCGSGERGGPIFSASVNPAASFYGALTATGIPTSSGGVNRNNCSSFFARIFVPDPAAPGDPTKSKPRVWINATGRAVFGFNPFVSDWEYQVRFDSGDPFSGAGKSCTLGVVPNSGNFAASASSSNCSYTVNF